MRVAVETGPPSVVRVEPPDGAVGVLRDAPLVARLSHALDPDSLSAETVRVADEAGPVPARLELSAEGLVLICRPARLLEPGVAHRLDLQGLRDRRGRQIAAHSSQFVAGGLTLGDLRGGACAVEHEAVNPQAHLLLTL